MGSLMFLALGLATLLQTAGAATLSIRGDHFYHGNTQVFLSGANAAWVYMGTDFGDGQFRYRQGDYQKYLDRVAAHGGNSLRVFVHGNLETTPNIDSHGMTVGCDSKGTFNQDLKDLLEAAKHKGVLVFFVLFNGAQKKDQHWKLNGLILDDHKRDSYIAHCLTPMLTFLKGHAALGGIEIMNEMEGMLRPEGSGDACFNTQALAGSGAGFASLPGLYSAQQLLRFINYLAAGVRAVDPSLPVTSGSWNPKSNTDNSPYHNLYRDDCLRRAGGKQQGVLSFYSTHTYAKASGDHYDEISPFYHSGKEKSWYKLDKPLVIAEFSQHKGDGWRVQSQYQHAFYHGYAGAWGWMYKQESGDHDEDTADVVDQGMNVLNGQAGIRFSL